jgi:hypothetical protein
MSKIDDRTLDVALVFDRPTIISRWVETRRLDHRFLTHAFYSSCLDKAPTGENNARPFDEFTSVIRNRKVNFESPVIMAVVIAGWRQAPATNSGSVRRGALRAVVEYCAERNFESPRDCRTHTGTEFLAKRQGA